MNFTHLLPRSCLMIAISLGLSACDSVAVIGAINEPAAAAALEQQSDNLLANGSFESQINGDDWSGCSSISDFSNDATPSEGSNALSISNGTCLSQAVVAIPGATYLLSCDARAVSSGLSSITVGFTDENSASLGDVQEIVITSTDYTTISSAITAPATADSADVLIYSESEAAVDNCTLTRVPDPELINGDFSSDLTGWQVCKDSTGDISIINSPTDDSNKQVSLSGGGCIYQVVDVNEIVATGSDILNINLTCDTQTDASGYASISLGYRDAKFDQLSINVENVITGSTDGMFKSELEAPFGAQFAEVMIFSTSLTTVDNCTF